VPDGERPALVTAPECAGGVERQLGRPAAGLLSSAAMEALAIVAYEQPVTRADIRQARGVDRDAVVDTLLAHGLVADDPRFGGRGRIAFLVTTASFLRHLGLGSLADLPSRSALGAVQRVYLAGTGRPHTVGCSSPGLGDDGAVHLSRASHVSGASGAEPDAGAGATKARRKRSFSILVGPARITVSR